MADELLHKQGRAEPGPEVRRQGKYLLWYAGGGLLAVVAVLFALAQGGGSSVGAAPNFAVDLYQGEERLGVNRLEIADLRGEPVALNFRAGLCPPCRAEMPDFQLFYEEFQDRVVVLGVDLGQYTGLGTRADALALLNRLGVTYPAGSTDDSSVIKEYEVLSMPTTVFITAKGEIFEKWSGSLTREVLVDLTNKMLAPES